MRKFAICAMAFAIAAASTQSVRADVICPDSAPKVFENVPGTAGPAIPDNQPATGANLSITVPDIDQDCPLIWDLNVDVLIRHSWQGDLTLRLTHVESGTSVVLMNRPGFTTTGFGFSNDNLGNPTTGARFIFDDEAANVYDTGSPGTPVNNPTGSWRPENSLSAYDQLAKAGTWTLNVTDSAGSDTGRIEGFSLHFVNKVPEPATLGLLAIGSLALIRRRR